MIGSRLAAPKARRGFSLGTCTRYSIWTGVATNRTLRISSSIFSYPTLNGAPRSTALILPTMRNDSISTRAF